MPVTFLGRGDCRSMKLVSVKAIRESLTSVPRGAENLQTRGTRPTTPLQSRLYVRTSQEVRHFTPRGMTSSTIELRRDSIESRIETILVRRYPERGASRRRRFAH